MMARLYARLGDLRNNKNDDETGTTTSSDYTARQRDRRRIRTALRRLLTERLFPDQIVSDRNKKDENGADPETQTKDDNLASGTVTPLTLGSRSKTAISIRSRADTRDGTQSSLKGRVVFVGENNNNTTESITDGKRRAHSAIEGKETKDTPGYYRRHLGPVRNPNNISRLFQPARSPTNLSKTSIEGMQRDQAFLNKLKEETEILDETARPTSQNGLLSPSGETTKSSSIPRDIKSGKRPNLNWTYNLEKGRENFDTTNGSSQCSGKRKLQDLDDMQLKNLLQELYKDKKYMDKVISSHNDNNVDEEIAISLEQSREYLLQRALYWLEQGPPPPRPPTTELGLRLEREQTVHSPRNTRVKGDNPESSNGGRAQSSMSSAPSNESKPVKPKSSTGSKIPNKR